MKKLLFILSIFLTFSASAQLSTSKTWNFRTTDVQGRKPITADFPLKSVVCHSPKDSILWVKKDSIYAAYQFFPYTTARPNVHKVTVTSEARYAAPFYANSVKTTTQAGYVPTKDKFPYGNSMIINWADSTSYQVIRGVVTKTWIIYPYMPEKSVAVQHYDIYVSESGSDLTGDGSFEKPCKSVYKASTIAHAGDSILIMEGIYTENNKCSFETGVSIFGEGKTKTIIKSNYNNSTYSNGLFTFYSSTYNVQGNQTVSGIGFDGNNYTCQRAIVVERRGVVQVYDCSFTNFKDSPAIFVGESYEYYKEAVNWITGNKFYNNEVSNCSTNTSGFQGLWFSGQDGFEVYGCNFQNMRGGVSGDAISSKTNKRWYIHDCIINRLPYVPGYWNFAVEIRWNYGECRYYNNQVTGCSDFCWNYSNGYAYSIDVNNCIFGHSLTSSSTVWNLGIDFEADNYNLIVRNSTFKYLACGILYSISYTASPVTLDGLLLHNNLFDNIGSPSNLSGYYEACLYVRPEQNDHTVKNLHVINNTFKQAAYSKGCITLGGQGAQTDIRVRNNIISGFTTAPVSIAKTNSGTLTIDTLTITHNNFYNNVNSNNVLFTAIAPTNYTTNNIITTDPLFISLTNYNLQAGSPCKNAGIDLGYGLNIGAY